MKAEDVKSEAKINPAMEALLVEDDFPSEASSSDEDKPTTGGLSCNLQPKKLPVYRTLRLHVKYLVWLLKIVMVTKSDRLRMNSLL